MNNSTKKSNWKYSNFKTKNIGPLKGIRVLDLSRVVAGNMTSLQLADFGAEVIKVEPLPDGDPLRTWKQGGESTFWKVYSRNKKSIGLDFRSPDFKEIISHLIMNSDVMIENFRPGTLEKMGFGFDILKQINPKLIPGAQNMDHKLINAGHFSQEDQPEELAKGIINLFN